MDSKMRLKVSKFLSLVLRHKPECLGIVLDENGWAIVNDILTNGKGTPYELSYEDLKDIVDSDEKGRYAFNEDCTKIRACQGHSVNIDLGLTSITPPDVLYHGTSKKSINIIREQGICKMSRNYVHLSGDRKTATNVGSRHGKAVVLSVDAKAMHSDGYLFYLSDNGIWLTDYVPTSFIIDFEREKVIKR